MKKYTGKIMRFTLVVLVCICLIFVGTTSHRAQAALTITSSVVTDWNACAEGATESAGVIDISGSYMVGIGIQAFLDHTDAHEGTEFLIFISHKATGDEDWTEMTRFVGLVGDADSEAITNAPAAPGTTVLTVADTEAGLYDTAPRGRWMAIEEGVLADSEMIFSIDSVVDTSVTILDGTTVNHVATTLIWDVGMSKTLMIPAGSGSRAKVVINNGYDDDGTAATLNYRILKTITTAL